MDEPLEILRTCTTWAVVGASPNPSRDSYGIAQLLERRGYRVHRVHPTAPGALRAVHEIDEPVDCVDVFRRSEDAGQHVDEAIAIGAKAVWLQLGVIDHDAAARARAAGLLVAMDTCPAIELPRLDADTAARG